MVAAQVSSVDLDAIWFKPLEENELADINGGDGGLSLLGMSMVVGGAFVAALIVGGIAAYVIYHSKCEC